MNVVHQNTLVFEDVTLGLHVQIVVAGDEQAQTFSRHKGSRPQRENAKEYAQVVVNLALLAVLPQEAPEDTLPPHPEDLGGHTGLGGTLSLSGSGVASLCLCCLHLTDAGARVDDRGLLDDDVVAEQLLAVLWRSRRGERCDNVSLNPSQPLRTAARPSCF